jgi:hypothetical protein
VTRRKRSANPKWRSIESAVPETVVARERGQVQAALALATAARMRRAELKRRIKDGTVLPSEVLLDPPDWCRTLPVGRLVKMKPRWGDHRVDQLLRYLPMTQTRELRLLTERQKVVLASMLEAKGC